MLSLWSETIASARRVSKLRDEFQSIVGSWTPDRPATKEDCDRCDVINAERRALEGQVISDLLYAIRSQLDR